MKDSFRTLLAGLFLMTGSGILLFCNSILDLSRPLSHRLFEPLDPSHRIAQTMDTYSSGLDVEYSGNMKYVLYWNTAVKSEHWLGLGSEPFKQCQVKDCYLTSNRTFQPVDTFDAILFHLRPFTFDDFPKKRNESQRYIMWSIEAPTYKHFDTTPMNKLQNIFNWTYTYRGDSDIVTPYGWLEQIGELPNFQPPEEYRRSSDYKLSSVNHASGKKKLAAWLVTNCSPTNGRGTFIRELQRYVQVDVYGKCGTKTCEIRAECDEMLEREYKFYISFENSNCIDYVTEKFFHTIKMNIIPIVYGGADYSKIAPPYSYIDIRNYSTAQELGEYLKLLDENDDLYNEYFWWKKFYKVKSEWYDRFDNLHQDGSLNSSLSLCGLCARLHMDKKKKSYESIVQWWGIQSNCSIPPSNFTTWTHNFKLYLN